MNFKSLFNYKSGNGGFMDNVHFMMCQSAFLANATSSEIAELHELKKTHSPEQALEIMSNRRNDRIARAKLRQEESKNFEHNLTHPYYDDLQKKDECREEYFRWKDTYNENQIELKQEFHQYVENTLTKKDFFSQMIVNKVRCNDYVSYIIYDKINGCYTVRFVSTDRTKDKAFSNEKYQNHIADNEYFRIPHIYEIQNYADNYIIRLTDCEKKRILLEEKRGRNVTASSQSIEQRRDNLAAINNWQARRNMIGAIDWNAPSSPTQSRRNSANSQRQNRVNERVNHVRAALNQSINPGLIDDTLF